MNRCLSSCWICGKSFVENSVDGSGSALIGILPLTYSMVPITGNIRCSETFCNRVDRRVAWVSTDAVSSDALAGD